MFKQYVCVCVFFFCPLFPNLRYGPLISVFNILQENMFIIWVGRTSVALWKLNENIVLFLFFL